MNPHRILDAVWSTCGELARREAEIGRIRWSANRVLREASGCILASQVPHAMAVAAVERLAAEYLLPTSKGALSDLRIAAVLRSPLSADYPRAYRFPAQAARRLGHLAAIAGAVVGTVLGDENASDARRALVRIGCGLGAKQASLLLRNVRVGAELAVLDVHLLSFMRLTELTTAIKVPAGLAQYEALEDRFRTYAYGLGVPMQRLDVAAWIVMRAARTKEFAWPS